MKDIIHLDNLYGFVNEELTVNTILILHNRNSQINNQSSIKWPISLIVPAPTANEA